MVKDKPENIELSNNPELVEHQLAVILSSVQFKSAKKMQAFLKYVVRKTLSGKQEQLKQYTIAVEALGFPTDFDSDTNPVVRIMAGRVRERLENYYADEGVNDALLISIPKGSYTPVFEEKARTMQADSFAESKRCSIPPKLAVLCYSDETQDKESNRLLYQITDTMAKELSYFLFSRLVVSIPHADKRESRFASIEIKERFQADYMLIFYIQQLPKDKHVLIVRLMDVEDEQVLWSDSYPVNKQDFSDQHDIIGNITAVVTDIQQGVLHRHWGRKLLTDEASIPPYHQSQAFYRYYLDDFGRDAFAKSVGICKQYLDNNPKDVISLLLYADYCRRDYVYGYNTIDEPLIAGQEVAERAVRLNASSHEANYVLGQILFCQGEYRQCYETLQHVRELYQYNASIDYGVGFHYCLMGKWDEGLEIVNKVMSTSKNFPSWCNFSPFLYHFLNDEYELALSYAIKIKTPQIYHKPLSRCVAYISLGEVKKAKSELQDLLLRYPNFMEEGEALLQRHLGAGKLADKLWAGILKASQQS